MKTDPRIKAVMAIILVALIGLTVYITTDKKELNENTSELLLANNILDSTPNVEKIDETKISANHIESTTIEEVAEKPEDENKVVEEVVYDGLTRQQLIDKLNNTLNSTLSEKGELFANYSLELGIDPYLAVAIVLHETGCSWDCSDLVKQCNNVGGQKGAPGCFGGAYASFATLDEGIISYMNNLYNNYYAYGLTTPETINPKYAASTTWASSINNYINKIRAS